VYRGARVAGLVRYLWGPGRHNEHTDPHLVACWRGSQPAVLAEVEPALLVSGYGDDAPARRDFTALVAELEAALRLREALSGTPAGQRVVWHCPLRVADTDRELTDAQWAEVAEDLLRRTGLDPAGGRTATAGADSRGEEQAGCRWVAVRHDALSIHVVVLLAREDGSAANPRFDYRRVRETCLAAEQRYGLQVTAPIDGTAVPAVSRAETEKAGRRGADSSPRTRGSGEQARVALRRALAAAPWPPAAKPSSSPGCAAAASSSANDTAPASPTTLRARPPAPNSTTATATSTSNPT